MRVNMCVYLTMLTATLLIYVSSMQDAKFLNDMLKIFNLRICLKGFDVTLLLIMAMLNIFC